MFLYCFDVETKDKLLTNEYKYIGEKTMKNQKVYVFFNNGKHLNFEKGKVMITNIMHL